jgi:two-component system, OmpR family, response regulator
MSATALRTVLYVDDEPDIREIVRIALGLTRGLTVHTASSGEQALTLVRELRPDLVLLDVMMPGLDGPGTLGRLRKDPNTARIPAIFMTAKAMPKEVALLLEMGALGVIAKPFDPMQLGAQVTSLWHRLWAESSGPAKVTDHSGLQRQVTKFGERFLQRTRKEAVRLHSLIDGINPGDMAQIEELKNLAHRIRGSGSTFGFSAVSECAGEIERMVDGLKGVDARAGAAIESRIRRRLTECTQRLSREVEAAAVR